MTTIERLSTEGEPEERYDFELAARLDDDDFFEPTIVRGRE
ncbi:hypothetical protein [Actinocrispum wychmicini]|uniref:Uncharacterized protein n=1 Tax=Actinocrispum wychmicini TaxID=1213861 RepID=A0A4R2IVU5_9PSEU|nr:hypothetical protein [Actinocrispum wychmicini]TCO48902.1 hypothetical protein EV192_115123 [Actinocrispum wychmicini]